jgi:hypothetical protein
MPKTNFPGGITAGLPAGTPPTTVADLTVSVGTSDGTIADVTGSFSQTVLNNNFRDLADKQNALLAALRAAGVIA